MYAERMLFLSGLVCFLLGMFNLWWSTSDWCTTEAINLIIGVLAVSVGVWNMMRAVVDG